MSHHDWLSRYSRLGTVTMFQNLFTTIAHGDSGAAAFYRQD